MQKIDYMCNWRTIAEFYSVFRIFLVKVDYQFHHTDLWIADDELRYSQSLGMFNMIWVTCLASCETSPFPPPSCWSIRPWTSSPSPGVLSPTSCVILWPTDLLTQWPVSTPPSPPSVSHVLPHRVSLPATHVFPVMDFSSQQRPLEQCFAAPLHMSQPPFVKSFVCCFLPTSGFLYERAKPFTVSTIGTTCTLPIIKTPHYSNLCCALLVLFTAAGESQSVSTVLMFGQTSPTCHGLFSTPATIVCACCVISLWTFR